jgi:WD40 repeat protein
MVLLRFSVPAFAVLLTACAPSAAQSDIYGDPLPDGAIGRLGTVRLRHAYEIGTLVFLNDAKSLASMNDGRGEVCIWDTATGKKRTRYATLAHATALSNDRRLLALLAHDAAEHPIVVVHELATGKVLRKYPPVGNDDSWHGTSFCFLGDTGRLAVRTGCEEIQLFDLQTASPVSTLHVTKPPGEGDIGEMSASPDGALLAVTHLEPKHRDTQVRNVAVYDTSTGKVLYRYLPGPYGSAAVFCPDGSMLATVDDNQDLVLREARTGKHLHALGPVDLLPCVTFAPDGRTLAFVAGDGDVRVWDIPQRRSVRTLHVPVEAVQRLIFAEDGKSLLTAGIHGFAAKTLIQVWRVPTGKLLCGITVSSHSPENVPIPCALSRDGRTFAVGSYNTIRLWDVGTGTELHARSASHAGISFFAVASNGQTIATGGADDVIRIWDTSACKELARWSAPIRHEYGISSSHRVAFTPDAKMLALVDKDGRLSLSHATDGKLVRQLEPPMGCGWPLLAPDGKTVLWSVGDGILLARDLATGQHLGGLYTSAPEPSEWVNRGFFSMDGQRFLRVYAEDIAPGVCVCHWQTTTGRPLAPLQLTGNDYPVFVAYSPDDRMIAGISLAYDREDDVERRSVRHLVFWEAATGQQIRRINAPGDMSRLAFSRDGRLIAVGLNDGTIEVWDVVRFKRQFRLRGHRRDVTGLAFSPDGKLLVSASADATVLLWDVKRFAVHRAGAECPPGVLDDCWKALAHNNAAKAYAAIRALLGAPKHAVPFLADKLRPLPGPDEGRLREWIAKLDSDEFAIRQAATEELSRLGELAEPVIYQALTANLSLEARRRLQALLKPPRVTLTADELQQLRAIQVLELIGTSEVERAVRPLADVAPGTRQTREARESLERLARRAIGAVEAR